MDRQRQVKLLRGLFETQHFIFEPGHYGEIVAGAYIRRCSWS
ncbi:hypothetical protein [Bradyrhizobium sp. C-145]|nr:hypothetical protein [Bradyrhizobium sp. C-145]